MIAQFRNSLLTFYEAGELDQLIYLCFEDVVGFTKTDLVTRRNELLSSVAVDSFMKVLSGLESGMPVQYVLGHAWFYGMKLKVSPAVLIPRQETEELVEWILKDALQKKPGSGASILDLCTGSGCIALALKKQLPEFHVDALDNSELALDIAKSNAEMLGLKVSFIHYDLLKEKYIKLPGDTKYDFVVCNPPYVTLTEKSEMHTRVKDFEPHTALFVEDDDPLLFYRRILSSVHTFIKAGGSIYFEINEALSEGVQSLTVNSGFQQVELRKDMNDKWRMIKVSN